MPYSNAAHALENDAPDVGILAYGTHDVLATVEVSLLVAQTARHVRRLLSAGALPLVALVPPARSDDPVSNRTIDALNAALQQDLGNPVTAPIQLREREASLPFELAEGFRNLLENYVAAHYPARASRDAAR